jgi:dolichol kinase
MAEQHLETSDAELARLIERTHGPQPWRRLFHAAVGVLTVLVLHYLIPANDVALVLMGAALGVVLLFEWARLTKPRLNLLFFRFLLPLVSPGEDRKLVSSVWYLVGMLLVVGAFPRGIALPSILVLALADPAASYVGRRWGRTRLGTGTVTGSLTLAVTSLIVLVPFVGVGPALATSVVASAVEALPWGLNDNLTIPVSSGLTLWIATLL